MVTTHRHSAHFSDQRDRVLIVFLDFLFLCIIGRLFYWQVIHHSVLQAQAEDQYTRTISLNAHRGKILTADGYTLVTNKPAYRLFAQTSQIKETPSAIAQQLAPLLLDPPSSISAELVSASLAAQLAPQMTLADWQNTITNKLSDPKAKWVTLKSRIDAETKQKIDTLHLDGLSFEQYEVRDYPEASMAANITGFVGKDKDGNDQGYFGIEGALDRELRGYSEQQTYLKDALGFHLFFDQPNQANEIDGRNVVLTIRRDIQYMVEQELAQGVAKYQASEGEAVVMDPKTGKILAMATYPSYSQDQYALFPTELYKNAVVADTYEPGSIFKTITVSAGIDSGKVTEDTNCTQCDGPRHINEYTIRTWNDQYHPNISVKDALAKSDNVAMIFISDLLGADTFIDYVHRFKIGEPTHVELQEDTPTPLRKDWKPIDLATASFGQGIVTTGLQMVRAVGAIANQGVMMRPTIIEKVIDPSRNSETTVPPIVEGNVISASAAASVTRMMVYAADTGEAKWTASKTHLAAGKTGTAQVPIAGHYDKDKTVASFIGFAPPDNPQFVMLVKLREPKSSPWAAETAAPLWYQIANKLFLLLNIPPDR